MRIRRPRLRRQLKREGIEVVRTVGDAAAPCPTDRVQRPSKADQFNALWVSDFTDVSTWQGFAYVAPGIDDPPTD